MMCSMEMTEQDLRYVSIEMIFHEKFSTWIDVCSMCLWEWVSVECEMLHTTNGRLLSPRV